MAEEVRIRGISCCDGECDLSFLNEEPAKTIESDHRDYKQEEHDRVLSEQQRSLAVRVQSACKVRLKQNLERVSQRVKSDAVVRVTVRDVVSAKLVEPVQGPVKKARHCADIVAEYVLFAELVRSQAGLE